MDDGLHAGWWHHEVCQDGKGQLSICSLRSISQASRAASYWDPQMHIKIFSSELRTTSCLPRMRGPCPERTHLSQQQWNCSTYYYSFCHGNPQCAKLTWCVSDAKASGQPAWAIWNMTAKLMPGYTCQRPSHICPVCFCDRFLCLLGCSPKKVILVVV